MNGLLELIIIQSVLKQVGLYHGGIRIHSGSTDSNGWYGHIQGVLFFDEVLSEQDRFKIHYYLANKWGLQEEVDSDGDGEMDMKQIKHWEMNS